MLDRKRSKLYSKEQRIFCSRGHIVGSFKKDVRADERVTISSIEWMYERPKRLNTPCPICSSRITREDNHEFILSNKRVTEPDPGNLMDAVANARAELFMRFNPEGEVRTTLELAGALLYQSWFCVLKSSENNFEKTQSNFREIFDKLVETVEAKKDDFV